MTLTVKGKTGLVVAPSVQRRAGIRSGDRPEFKVSSRTITIVPVKPSGYEPTKAELAAIRKGQAAIVRGNSVGLTDFLNGLTVIVAKPAQKQTAKFPAKIERGSDLLSAQWRTTLSRAMCSN